MPLTRGFLFADLRGYTDFVQASGDAAARDLLKAYRGLVREVVGRFDGSEIKTEGDSFYVVFPSTSGAVRCALDIVVRAGESAEPPIRVGIGIHAGESVEDGEGYVGLAVNIAARICAEARSGEVLVSDTVRSLTRGAADITFTARGRRQLKGVSEPILLYAVTDGRVAKPARTARRVGGGRTGRKLGGLAVAAVAGAVVVGAILIGRPGASSEGAAPSGSASHEPPSSVTAVATSAPSATPAEPLPLPISDGMAPHVTAPPGTYRTTNFKPAMTFRLSTGWEAMLDEPDAFELNRQTSSRGKRDGGLSFSRSRIGYAGPCSTDKTIRIGDTTDAMLDWIEGLDFVTWSDPTPITIGGASGVQLEGAVDAKPASCPNAPTAEQDWYALLSDSRGVYFFEPGTQVGLTVLDVDGQPVLMITEQAVGSETDVGHEIDAVLVTIAFD
jgi:class 3 adenylate cyclase